MSHATRVKPLHNWCRLTRAIRPLWTG